MVRQVGDGSTVDINVKDAVPNTVFTVWMRIKGVRGLNPAGSPLTGGGATPLAPGSALDSLHEYSPWADVVTEMPGGSPNPTNGFTTNNNGDAHFSIDLDFPLVRGAYPFQMTERSRPGREALPNVPTAIADPREPGQEDRGEFDRGTPFLLRVISHCTDQVGHGLSPGTREAWFQYP